MTDSTTFPPPSPVTLVLPGFMATNLIDRRSGAVLWGTVHLVFRDVRLLALDERGICDADPGMAVTPTVPFPAMYEPLWTALRQRGDGGHRVIPWGYDFRRDVRETAAKLVADVEALDGHPALRNAPRSSEGKLLVNLVGHSTACLVARIALQGGLAPHLNRAVFLAPPWRGTVVAQDALQAVAGMKIGLSFFSHFTVRADAGKLHELARTFPSLYQLLPHVPELLDPDAWEVPISRRHLANAQAVWDLAAAPLPPAVAGKCATIAGLGTANTLWPVPSDGPVSAWAYPALDGDEYMPIETYAEDTLPVYTFAPPPSTLGTDLVRMFGDLDEVFMRRYLAIHERMMLYEDLQAGVADLLDRGETTHLPRWTPDSNAP